MRSYQQFFAELKRRHVFKVAAIYGAVAFGVLQVADPLGTALGLSDSFLSLVVGLLLLGFPVALVLAWAFEMTPEGVQKAEPAAPGEIEAIVAQPASKRWPAGLLAIAGAALLFGAWWMGRTTADPDAAGRLTPAEARLAFSTAADDSRPSIAVLPFVNMSADEDQEFFSDGMTEEILNVLVKTGQFRVPARTSVFTYKGQDKDARQIGSELGVTYLVEGSVRKAGSRLRITAQLIDAETDEHLLSETYDKELTAANMFEIQIDIAEAIANALTIPLGLDDPSDLVTPTRDLEAYDLYLAGRSAMRKRGESLNEAIRLFELAIARDSMFAPAWAALAETKEIWVWYPGDTYSMEDDIPDSLEVPRSLAESESAALRALELDPDNASAMVALGSVHRDRMNWSEAERLYRQAIVIDPDNAEAHQQYSELLAHRGRIAEAVRAADRAASLDPAPVRLFTLANWLLADDRRGDAADVLRFAMARDPDLDFPVSWRRAGTELARLGETEEAVRAMDAFLRKITPPDSIWWTRTSLRETARGLAEGRIGPAGDWDLGFRELLWMGLPDSAWAWHQEHNWAAGTTGLVWDARVWVPEFDSLRSGPRMRAYMERTGQSDAVLQRTPIEERTRPMILERERAP